MSDLFPLYRLTGARCQHHALLHFYLPPYHNWIEGSQEEALETVDRVHWELRERLERHLGCPGGHKWKCMGEAIALDEELREGNSHLDGLPLWVAETDHPEWFVVGMAKSHEAFWEDVSRASSKLVAQPLYPAVRRHVHVAVDEDLDRAITRALDLCNRGLWPV